MRQGNQHHVAFMDGGKPFDGRTARSAAAGGVQHGTVSLAEAFARAGHLVSVYNGTLEHADLHGVSWVPLNQSTRVDADLVIANHHAWLFRHVSRGKKIVWFRNPANLHRLWKRGNVSPIVRYRPHAVFLSRYHERTVSRLVPFASRRIIEHGSSVEFIRSSPAAQAPPPRAIFTSQPYRGLNWVLDVWARLIHPAVPTAELHVFAAEDQMPLLSDYKHLGVHRRERVARAELANELRKSRVLLCPGHWHETYCNAAAEATAAAVPVVSRGLGSLSERIQHEKNGYLAYDAQDFANDSIMLLVDDARWLSMHKAMVIDRDLPTWDDRVAEWSSAFLA
jgi:glycosyltransferase involved in cell wall biosynthesis